MRVSSVIVLAVGVAAFEEELSVLQVQGEYEAAHGDDHVGVVLPDPVWLRHSEVSELVIRNCNVAKKCSTFDGGKAFMDSMKDDTEYGYGTAHYGKHCCAEQVKQCETKFITSCNRNKTMDLTREQCEKVAGHVRKLSFQKDVERKHQFPGCYYRKVDGKTFWNSFVAEEGYGEVDGSHGDRSVYAPICKVRLCKNKKTEYKKVVKYTKAPVKYSKEKVVKYTKAPVKYSKKKVVKYTKAPVKYSKKKVVKYTKAPVKYSKKKVVKYTKAPVKYSKKKVVKYTKAPVKYSKEKVEKYTKIEKYSKAPVKYSKSPVKYSKEKDEKYTKAAYGDDHVDVVLPDPVWLRHSEVSKLVIRNCNVAKKCSTFDGGKAFMDSMKDDTEYGYGTAHYGKHCCAEQVQQCETKFITRCNRNKAKDLTREQCETVAGHVSSLSFQKDVERKHQFPGCYYRKADGKTFWNSFVAEEGYGEVDGSHGDRSVYAPICKVRLCKKTKSEYK